ncbi:S66 peptidase family protein [Pseudokineococcus marinus]|uniref:LD-carboxypeptidase n=1 Tax=Pseudokineococcus marinus TaxID=351215 RepID=A0A849BKY6_9ACTN|nr:S66 peptidase family protein [Pseudokineococcus marinus]NNH21973.1 LD-carboxypeptidase [Pseudokineococcus marinus]
MTVRLPRPLRPGDVVGVTAPSSGVPAPLVPRLDVAVDVLSRRGLRVRVGACVVDRPGLRHGEHVSAPAAERAAELQAMLLDPEVRAVVPPWGGELAVEVLPLLDWDALAAAEPTWLVGYSDTSTLTLALTTRLGWATLHGPNLLDTPYRVPEPLLPWLDVASAPTGTALAQGPSRRHRAEGFDDWEADPAVSEPTHDRTGTWELLDPGAGPVRARGRLLGGCVETTSILAGTPYGDVPAFAAAHAGDDGLLLHLEAGGDGATDVARDLWRMRLAGWFDVASAVLVGRTGAPASGSFTQHDAVRSALAGLDVPVVVDVDCGHVPPQLALVDGALAEVVVDPAAGERRLVQHLR